MIAAGTAARVLVVGLDMGDGTLIEHWGAQGHLPHLAALAASGASYELESPAAALHTSTWPTLATGVLPGHHGVYYPYQPTPGRQFVRHIGRGQYGAPTFWNVADAAGRRSVVYDVPETFPDVGFGGRAIFDWGTWAWYGEPATQPVDLGARLAARFGPYPLGYEAKRLALALPVDLEARLLRSVDYKARTAAWLLDDPWDVAIVGFCETHAAGHYLWPAGADGVASAAPAAFAPLLHVYQAIDEAIGALARALPAGTVLMVVSGDGVRPNRCGWHLLPAVLQRLGFTALRGRGTGPAAGGGASTAAGPAGGLARASAAARRFVSGALPWHVRDGIGMWLQTAGIDWSRTRAFALPTDLEGCIRINLRGREPHGVVAPGAEYRAICEELRERLRTLVNPATGAPAVAHVWIRDDIFAGPRREELPDVIVQWADDAPITALAAPDLGRVEGVNPDPRTGTHSTRGFLLASGSGVPAGLRGRAHLADIAPTVLRLAGVRGPAVAGSGLPALAAAPQSDVSSPRSAR
ncbi:MAG: alkaline phosphatase family protein [Vicinamibacterales bacterium]